jgi:uncharacterized integral membrane protein
MAEFDLDNAAPVVPNEQGPTWFNVPANSRVVVAKHTVYVEPDTKFYRICLAIARAFSLASLIAWFVLLILLIVLVFSMVNNLDSLEVMRSQQGLFQAPVSHTR